MAQLSVQLLRSGSDLGVCGFGTQVRLCPGSAEPAWDSLPLPCLPSHLFSFKINELEKQIL